MINVKSGIISKKIGMSRIFLRNGRAIPITVLLVDRNVILCIKKYFSYSSFTLGAFDCKKSKIKKSIKGVFYKSKSIFKKKMSIFCKTNPVHYKVGDKIGTTYFNIGQLVKVEGKSKGKGFAGVIKRHNFKGLEATHGVSIAHRSAGSTGQCQDPGRVFKGKKMAGRMGGNTVTKNNILLIDIDIKLNLLILKGTVPGNNGNYVYIEHSVKKNISL